MAIYGRKKVAPKAIPLPKKVLAANQVKSEVKSNGLPVYSVKKGYHFRITDDSELILEKDGIRIGTYSPSWTGLEMSCGVQEMTNIQSVFCGAYSRFPTNMTLAKKRELIKEAMILVFNDIKEIEGCAFIICSNNYVSNASKIINGVLDEICHTATKIVKNPGSRNSIRVWTI